MNKNIIFVVVALIVGFLGGMVFTTPYFGHNSIYMNSPSQDNHSVMNNDLPTTSRQIMDSMAMKIEGKEGNDFDEAFLETMIPHHQGAVQMAQLALTSSKRPEIIKLAQDIIDSQEKEIQTMRTWQRSWFGINAQ
jgi:uncharacterized protein (DUF305 family)